MKPLTQQVTGGHLARLLAPRSKGRCADLRDVEDCAVREATRVHGQLPLSGSANEQLRKNVGRSKCVRAPSALCGRCQN